MQTNSLRDNQVKRENECWEHGRLFGLESLRALALHKSSPYNQIFIEGICANQPAHSYGWHFTTEMWVCVYVCPASECTASWLLDPCPKAEPEEKENSLGSHWVRHLFPWMWSVWIRPFCISCTLKHTHRDKQSRLVSACFLIYCISWGTVHLAVQAATAPCPCVWTSV